MKFKTITAKNIYSYLNFSIDFLDYSGATTIILGKNLDQKTANAAGKTSILKALYWVLWNKELDGANIESMICRESGNGMVVVLEFEDRGSSYKITRWKDYKPTGKNDPLLHDGKPVSGSGVDFIIDGEAFNGESHTQTQKIIEMKLRMSPRLFLSAVLSAQDGTNHFLTANDSDKKELLSELLDLQAYSKAFENIKKEIKTKEDELGVLETQIASLQEQISNLEDQEMGLKEKEAVYDHEKKIKVETLKEELETIKKEGQELRLMALKENPAPAIRSRIEVLQKDIKANKDILSTELSLIQEKSKLESEIRFLTDKKDSTQKIIEEKTQELDSLKSNIFEEKSQNASKLPELLSSLKEKEDSLETLSLKLRHKSSLEINLKSIEGIISSLNKDKEALEHEINEAKNNSMCSSCLRKFSIEDNDSLKTLISKIEEKILIVDESLSNESMKKEKVTSEIILLSNLDSQIEELKKSISQTKIEIEKERVIDQENKIKEENNKNLKNQISSLEKSIEQSKESLEKYKTEEPLIKKKIQAIENEFNKFTPIKNTVLSLEESLLKEQSNLLDAQEIQAQIQEASKRVKEKEDLYRKNAKELDSLEKNPNPFTDLIVEGLKQQERLNSRKDGYKGKILDIQDDLKYLNFWKVGFAPTGIRSFITDDVIELLNRKTQENLNDLFDGSLSVVFDPETQNKKGVSSNKISTFFILNGKETPFELLSGGEKRRAILATDLALTDIAEARSGTKLNVRFLDEPFNGIDDNGQIKSLVLFSRLAREKDGFFIISHEEKFQNLCQKALYVIKEKGISKIVGRSEFMNADIDKQDSIMEDSDSNILTRKRLLRRKKTEEDEEDEL